MRLLLPVFLMLFSPSASAQRVRSGRVVSGTNRRPVPYAAVGVVGQSRGTYADEQGHFTLDGLRSDDSLRVSSVGYQTKRVRVGSLGNPAEIQLDELPVPLAEVPIRREGGTVRRVGSQQNVNPRHFFVSGTGQSTWELASWLPGSTDSSVTYLKSVGFFIGGSNKPKAPFRVRVYAVRNGQPGGDLLRHSLVTAARRGGAWHDVDGQDWNLRVPPGGIFVSMEWLYGTQRKFFTYSTLYPKYPDRSVSQPLVYYGQSLGATPEFALLRTYGRLAGGEWKLQVPPPGFLPNANAMIRAEYLVYD
jgi:hypothetical protein